MLVDLKRWSEFISTHPESHILQDGRWGELKAGFGWQPQHLISGDAGTQILFRKLPFGYSIGYIPKGPVGFNKSLLEEIDEVCRAHKSIFLKIEPFEWEPGNARNVLEKNGFVQGSPIQPRRTVTISLAASEEDLLAGMKQKTRYNIRLAEKKDIVVRSCEDYQLFHKMAMETGERDNFGIHSLEYYLKLKENFGRTGLLVLLMAYFEEKPIAGVIVLAQGKNAWYMYGASTGEERNRMPTYLLQWEAIKWAKGQGCSEYDLWGIPDHEEAELEALFNEKQQHDGLWGVYRFKRGFGGTIRRSVGAWDKPYHPGLFKLYQLYSKLRNRGME
jgi:peptidoglycan pentaglycine glycine transferase (the first glycine)